MQPKNFSHKAQNFWSRKSECSENFPEKKINLICEARLKKYLSITKKAFKIAGKSINPGKKQEAKEILEMSSCYIEDAEYFKKQGNYVNSFACINYAHGWLDAGARLGIFKVKDSRLFTLKQSGN